MLHFNNVMENSVMLAAGCFLYRSWEALLIGTVGGIIACVSMPLIDKMRIDDPVGASSVHGNNISVSTDALKCR
jgi:ammonia channel protein AmtB